MELKRILARDVKTANEKAVAQYGEDVLIISSCQVRGQTELIVAVDLESIPAEEALLEQADQPIVRQRTVATDSPFAALLGHNLDQHKRLGLVKTPEPVAAVRERSAPPEAQPVHDERDYLRGREIVAMVRDELTNLRKEFKMGQQMALWQGGVATAPGLVPLRNALNEAPIPSALRALLLDSLAAHEEPASALDDIRQHLSHSLKDIHAEMPIQGVHVLAGPSGSGKTLMVARLAQHGSMQLGCEKVAVISFCDQRAGAWNQTQLLCAQSGVDGYRAHNVGTLKLLLDELSSRTLVIIDTPGVQMNDRLSEVASVCPQARYHAVVQADASAVTLRRLCEQTTRSWDGFLLTKLDESSQPWPLIQLLTEGGLRVCTASRGERAGDWGPMLSAAELVHIALQNLNIQAAQSSDALAAAAVPRALTGARAAFAPHNTGALHGQN